MAVQTEWFCALLDTAEDVYFRFSLTPPRGFAYVSPSVRGLTGRPAADFCADRNLCVSLVVPADRSIVRRLLRARRQAVMTIRVVRDSVAIPVEVRTVALVRHGRLIAIEGVARLAVNAHGGGTAGAGTVEPVQQRLAALMFQVHDLLHRVLPPDERGAERAATGGAPPVLRLGDLALDTERLTVTESGASIALTPREVLLLRYLLERPGRVVTRRQLLADVWSYRYDGDDRTVDVHVSRLRRKLPSLQGRLVAIRNIGYRLQQDADATCRVARG